MIPNTFCLENSLEIIPHARRKLLEGEARKWANAGLPVRYRWRQSKDLWEYVIKEHERIVWVDAYYRRKARLQRMAA